MCPGLRRRMRKTTNHAKELPKQDSYQHCSSTFSATAPRPVCAGVKAKVWRVGRVSVSGGKEGGFRRLQESYLSCFLDETIHGGRWHGVWSYACACAPPGMSRPLLTLVPTGTITRILEDGKPREYKRLVSSNETLVIFQSLVNNRFVFQDYSSEPVQGCDTRPACRRGSSTCHGCHTSSHSLGSCP